jgi:hypothetical protein
MRQLLTLISRRDERMFDDILSSQEAHGVRIISKIIAGKHGLACLATGRKTTLRSRGSTRR